VDTINLEIRQLQNLSIRIFQNNLDPQQLLRDSHEVDKLRAQLLLKQNLPASYRGTLGGNGINQARKNPF